VTAGTHKQSILTKLRTRGKIIVNTGKRTASLEGGTQMKRFLLAIGLSFFLTSFAFAGESISLGNVAITLGDQKAAILRELEKSYRVQEDSVHPGSFFKKNSRMSGTIEFANNDKVFSVSKDWGAFGESEAVETVRAVMGAMTSLGDRLAYVSLRTIRGPQLTIEVVKWSSGTKEIREVEIVLSAERGHRSIHISEHLYR
jgi:hypothetical protein